MYFSTLIKEGVKMTSQDQFLYFRGLNPEEVNITPIGTYCAQSIFFRCYFILITE